MSKPFHLPTAADPIGTFDATAAWFGLPQSMRDLIGTLAIRAEFGFLVAEENFAPEDHVFGEAVHDRGFAEHTACFSSLVDTISAALPEVFGTKHDGPKWMEEVATAEQKARWAALDAETDEQFLDRAIVQPLMEAFDPYTQAALNHEWTPQRDGSWLRLAYDEQRSNTTVGNDRRAVRVASAKEACEWDRIQVDASLSPAFTALCDDRRTDSDIVSAAVRGLHGVFAPAPMLTEA